MIHLKPLYSAMVPCHVIHSESVELPNTDEYLIKFRDGIEAFYPGTLLGGLTFFNKHLKKKEEEELKENDPSGLTLFRTLETCSMIESSTRTINLPECDFASFQLILALVFDKKNIRELVNDESLEHPYFFEEIRETLSYLCLDKKDEIIKRIAFELEYPLPSQARAILKNYIEEDEKEVPYLVKQARIVKNCALFFQDKKAAQSHFEHLNETINNILSVNKKIKKMEEKLPLSKGNYEIFLKDQINLLDKQLSHWYMERTKSINMFTLGRCPVFSAQLVSKHVESPNQCIRTLAKEAFTVVENYKTKILDTLKKQGMRDRPDLLKYLIGPDAFLFDYYDITPCEKPQLPKNPFTHASVTNAFLGYYLDNLGPWHLEEEIRSDLMTYIKDEKNLPPRLIKEPLITFEFSPDFQILQKDFLEKFNNWHLLTDEDKNNVKQKLIEINEWNEFEIKPYDFEIDPQGVNPENITGTLKKFHPNTKFDLNTVSLYMIMRTGGSNPDSRSSKEFLQKMKQGGWYNYGHLILE